MACTGFLIADDLLMTAGHCLLNSGRLVNGRNLFCEYFRWVFDFNDLDGRIDMSRVPSEKVFACDTVLFAANESTFDKATKKLDFKDDWAIIKLNRPTNRPTLPLSTTAVQIGDTIRILGHAFGGSLSTTTGYKISDHSLYHRLIVDSFEGNSGSPIINADGEVSGFLVRGYPKSFYPSIEASRQCDRVNSCDDRGENCKFDEGISSTGEHAQKIDQRMIEILQSHLGSSFL